MFLVACTRLYVTMLVGWLVSQLVGRSIITSRFCAFRAKKRADLSYCPCPDAILPLPTGTRLMLSCIRPCFFSVSFCLSISQYFPLLSSSETNRKKKKNKPWKKKSQIRRRLSNWTHVKGAATFELTARKKKTGIKKKNKNMDTRKKHSQLSPQIRIVINHWQKRTQARAGPES